MKKHTLFAFALLCVLLLLGACGGDYIRSDGTPPEGTVSVQAMFYHAPYGGGEALRADTLKPGDSVFFSSTISPSRNIQMSAIFWKLDSTVRPQISSFRAAFFTSGRHTVSFHVLDAFGDTLSDTVQIWISNPPVFGSGTLPSVDSWGITPHVAGTLFAWDCQDPDSADPTEYHFQLSQGTSVLLDTLLTLPHLQLDFPLPALQSFHWSVTARDSYGFMANPSLNQRFSTRGDSDEGGISTQATLPSTASSVTPLLQCQSFQSTEVLSATSTAPLTIAPLTPGNYRCWLASSLWDDLHSHTVTTTVHPGQMVLLSTLAMADTTPPLITALDTARPLLYTSPLLFRVKEGAPGTIKFSLYWNGQVFSGWKLQNDTLFVPPPANLATPALQTLSLQATDANGNSDWYSWEIGASPDWIQSLQDTLIQSSQTLTIPVCKKYGQSRAAIFLWDTRADGTWDEQLPEESGNCLSSAFQADQLGPKVRVGIVFNNKLMVTKEFTVTVNRPPAGSPKAVYPIYKTTVGPHENLVWARSTDPDGDPVHYQIEYKAASEGIWKTVGPSLADTVLSLAFLPSVTESYSWRVRSMDNRGGSTLSNWTSLFTLEAP